jgi:hypothetical protein
MSIITYLIDTYFEIMKSVNVRSVSIAIIVLIILIEIVELFIKPEDEIPQAKPVKNKEEKTNLLKKIVNINKKPQKKETKKLFEKDKENNYYVPEKTRPVEEKNIPINEELELLGSKTIEINTVIDGNRIYMEKKEKIIQN